jgi:hypothetical protein
MPMCGYYVSEMGYPAGGHLLGLPSHCADDVSSGTVDVFKVMRLVGKFADADGFWERASS